MKSYIELIEEKYKSVSKLPENLMRFTEPIRQTAVSFLHLSSGSSVIDVGCGTGASFSYLEKVIGRKGSILGVEPSKSMMAAANQRVRDNNWKNISLVEATIEEVETREKFDGALLFAMHDVFNSLEGLQKIREVLKDGAYIVCVGPKIQEKGFTRVFNPMLHLLFKRMALSQENKDKPWRMIENVFTTERILEEKHGLIFIYIGRKQV